MSQYDRSAARVVGTFTLALCCGCGSAHHDSNEPGRGGVGGSSMLNTSGGATFELGDAAPLVDAASCASISERATAEKRPVDIIFVIDNSGSMSEEIAAVEARINDDFAGILSASGADYRVIMISKYGEKSPGSAANGPNDICIRAPLGAGDCSGTQPKPTLNAAPRFYQQDVEIMSQDAWCKLIDGFAGSDGWGQYARPEAFKSIVIVSDDESECTTAAALASSSDPVQLSANPGAFVLKDPSADAARFDVTLRALSVEQFGTAERRKYRVHSIVGVVGNTTDEGAWPPSAPLQAAECGSDVDAAGEAHQALSILTGGLRFPICAHDNFNVVFRALAADALQAAQLSCEWKIPPPPSGEAFDPGLVNLEYHAGGGATVTTIPKVNTLGDCRASGGWYYDQDPNPSRVLACPATCQTLEADSSGAINLAFGCSTIVDVR